MSDNPLSLLAQLAERAASSPQLEGAVLGAVRATLPGVIMAELRKLFPGETVRLYVPKVGTETRSQRDTRITAALKAGMSVADIVREHRVPETTVRRANKRLRGHIGGGI